MKEFLKRNWGGKERKRRGGGEERRRREEGQGEGENSEKNRRGLMANRPEINMKWQTPSERKSERQLRRKQIREIDQEGDFCAINIGKEEEEEESRD